MTHTPAPMAPRPHTPGPWTATRFGYEKYSINGARGEEITACHRSNDAQLIAAAPEMYQALKAIEAALRKDSRSKTISRDTVEYHLDGQEMYQAINAVRAVLARVAQS